MMKKIVSVQEVSGEGFEALLGEQITCFCAVYIYTGKLIGVNDTCILLENPKIVYETGDFNTKSWKDAQALPNNLYIQKGMVESFCILK
jgi:hypothetical protein